MLARLIETEEKIAVWELGYLWQDKAGATQTADETAVLDLHERQFLGRDFRPTQAGIDHYALLKGETTCSNR
jgi:hypothetical protein